MSEITTVQASADERRPRHFDALIAAIPIILVNTLAVVGQCQWAGTHLHWARPGQALFAGALETVALAVMYLAHRSLIEGDSAVRLRLGAYLIACGSATVNYQEHSNNWHPVPAAFVFAGASLLSPILWAMYSRFASREVMRSKDLIDRRAAKFALARWTLFPRRTFAAFRYSVWHSIQSPAEAIAGSDALRNRSTQPAVVASVEPEPAAELASPEPRRLLPEQERRQLTAPVIAPQVDSPAMADDIAVLENAEPPAWSSMTLQAAVERADSILTGPRRGHKELSELLSSYGVSATANTVRQARYRARRRGELRLVDSVETAEAV